MTAEEKLARELYRVGTIAGNPHRRADELETWESRPETVKTGFMAAAKHVLRRERAAVRRARGRTIGWTTYSTDVVEEWCCRQDCEEAVRRSEGGCALARVVAVPKPKKGGRK